MAASTRWPALWRATTSVALKSILKGLHVATSGRKAERAARLAAHLATNPELQSQPWAAAALTKVGNTLRNIPEPKWQHGGHGICAPTGYDAEVATRTARLEQQSPLASWAHQPCGDVSAVSSQSEWSLSARDDAALRNAAQHL